MWSLGQLKNSDAKAAIFVSLLSTGLGRQSGVPKGAKFAGLFFDHRAVLKSGPERSPRDEIREMAAVGQRERSSDRFAATPATRLAFCVVFERGAGYASRLAATERKLPQTQALLNYARKCIESCSGCSGPVSAILKPLWCPGFSHAKGH